jgi:hypothetical protein
MSPDLAAVIPAFKISSINTSVSRFDWKNTVKFYSELDYLPAVILVSILLIDRRILPPDAAARSLITPCKVIITVAL